MVNATPMMLVIRNIKLNVSMSYCFKILFAKFAKMNVENRPSKMVVQFVWSSTLENTGVIPPKTSAAKISLDKS